MLRYILLVIAFYGTFARAADLPTAPQNVMIEIAFSSHRQQIASPDKIVMDVIFVDPDAGDMTVPAFWAGGSTWKVRYASPIVGVHSYRTECHEDASLSGLVGQIEITKYTGTNPLYLHGPIRIAADHRHFEHLDATPFFWLGDTWWMGLTSRLHFPAEFATLLNDRQQKGFTVVQIVAGLYPDMPPFDPRGANEAGFPWEKDYSHIRPEYFDAADQRIMYLVDHGIVPCIVGSWGFHLPWLGIDKMKQHERYVYARWGALPIVWCAAGELNLPYYLAPEFPNHGQKLTEDWKQVLAYCRSINCFDRMITAHPTGIAPASMRGVFNDDTRLDFDMLQTPHGQMEVLAPTVQTVQFSYNLKPPTPVVNAEASYEMLFDKTPAAVSRAMFWASWSNGCTGYTYGANGIWQLNRREEPYGNSPWGGGYGKIAWNDAMNLPGSKQVGLAKKLFERFDWWTFRPLPGFAHWSDESQIKFGDWIWLEPNAAHDAPTQPRFFSKKIFLPKDAKITDAQIRITADDRFSLSINDTHIGDGANWQKPRIFSVTRQLRPGPNILFIRAENMPADVPNNPAGLNFALRIRLAKGPSITITSDESCQCSTGNNDWKHASIVAHYGDSPWGYLDSTNPYVIPYAIGNDNTQIIYVPQDKPIEVENSHLLLNRREFYFDPATGEEQTTTPSTRFAPPNWHHDWVLVFTPQ